MKNKKRFSNCKNVHNKKSYDITYVFRLVPTKPTIVETHDSVHMYPTALELKWCWMFPEMSFVKLWILTAGSLGQPDRQDIPKWLRNGKAVCFPLIRRITNFKMSIPKSSQSTVTLKRVAPSLQYHGTMSEPPWILHQARMNLWIDPSGTESCNMQTSLDY